MAEWGITPIDYFAIVVSLILAIVVYDLSKLQRRVKRLERLLRQVNDG